MKNKFIELFRVIKQVDERLAKEELSDDQYMGIIDVLITKLEDLFVFNEDRTLISKPATLENFRVQGFNSSMMDLCYAADQYLTCYRVAQLMETRHTRALRPTDWATFKLSLQLYTKTISDIIEKTMLLDTYHIKPVIQPDDPKLVAAGIKEVGEMLSKYLTEGEAGDGDYIQLLQKAMETLDLMFGTSRKITDRYAWFEKHGFSHLLARLAYQTKREVFTFIKFYYEDIDTARASFMQHAVDLGDVFEILEGEIAVKAI